MNPPYSGNLHLKILREAMQHSDDIVNLSPIRWLEDPLAEYKRNTDFQKFADIRQHIESLDVTSAKKSSEMFNMLVSTDLGIYHIDKNIHQTDLRNKLALKIYNTGHHFESFDENKKDGWRVRFVLVDNCKAGGSSIGGKIRFQRLLVFKDGMKDNKPWFSHFGRCGWTKETDYIPTSIKFESELEANNFVDVMTKTKFGRYYWAAMQQDIHVYPSFFIKLDFTHPWTDADLYAYFGLTADEIDIIEKEMA